MDLKRGEGRLTENVRRLEEELDVFANQAYPGGFASSYEELPKLLRIGERCSQHRGWELQDHWPFPFAPN
jgi:hypothetical protein